MNSIPTTQALEVVPPLPPPVHEGITSATDPIITDEQFNEAMRALGHSSFSASEMKHLAAAGIFLTNLGTLKVQRGGALVTQRNMQVAMAKIMSVFDQVDKGKARLTNKVIMVEKLARALTLITTKLTESQRFLSDLQPAAGPGMRPTDDNEIVNRSFIPGQDVQPNIVAKEVHIHR